MTAEAPEPARRSFDWGIGCFLALLLAVPLLAWYLISSRATDSSPGSSPPPRAEGTSWREERRLEGELTAAERDLAQVRREARADTQPETRAAWEELIDECEARVREARKRLDDYRSGR